MVAISFENVKHNLKKREIYSAYGIEYKSGKILAPFFGWINPLLINGNSKVGKGVYTWSTLAGNKPYEIDMTGNGEKTIVNGTCPVTCPGCYAMTGCYCFTSTKRSLARKTILARFDLDFMTRAIAAQIKADKIKLVRIHCAGDFFSAEYVDAWKDICAACPETLFWSYTKNPDAENAFNDVENCNIVKSLIPGIGFNFGKIGYIIRAYKALKDAGKDVYICRCGIDPEQHCTNCRGCSKNEYVLFVEHSTKYKAADDPLFPELVKIVNAQPIL